MKFRIVEKEDRDKKRRFYPEEFHLFTGWICCFTFPETEIPYREPTLELAQAQIEKLRSRCAPEKTIKIHKEK